MLITTLFQYKEQKNITALALKIVSRPTWQDSAKYTFHC